MKPDRLSTMADELLATVVALLVDPPDRQFVSHGIRFAHDCEQVAVGIGQLSFLQSDSGVRPGAQKGPQVPVVQFQVLWLRCWPTVTGAGALPSTDSISAAASGLAVDLANVAGGIGQAWHNGTLFTTINERQLVNVGPVQPVSPEGGLAGWRMQLTVDIS